MRILQKIGFNNSVNPHGAVLSGLDFFFLDLGLTNGGVFACHLTNTTSTASCFKSHFVGNRFELVTNRATLNHGVLAHKVLSVELIDPVLHILEVASCTTNQTQRCSKLVVVLVNLVLEN